MIGIIQKLKENVSCNLHFHKIFELLVENNNFIFVDINDLNLNRNNLKNYIIKRFNELPKYIVIYYGLTILSPIINILNKLNIKIILIIDDIHQSIRISKPRNRIIKKCDYIFNTYGYQINRWNLINHSKTFYFPHSAIEILSLNNKPINKILISGALNKEAYPDRDFICQFKKDTVILKKKCGYRDVSKGIYGNNYYKELNKYICCFSDLCIREYTLAKIFEIIASGSLLLCSNTPIKDIFENDLGLIDNIHYISCNQQNMKEKIDYILNPLNREEIDKIRINGQKIIKEKHYYKYRAQCFYKIINENFDLEYRKKYNKKYNTNYYLGF